MLTQIKNAKRPVYLFMSFAVFLFAITLNLLILTLYGEFHGNSKNPSKAWLKTNLFRKFALICLSAIHSQSHKPAMEQHGKMKMLFSRRHFSDVVSYHISANLHEILILWFFLLMLCFECEGYGNFFYAKLIYLRGIFNNMNHNIFTRSFLLGFRRSIKLSSYHWSRYFISLTHKFAKLRASFSLDYTNHRAKRKSMINFSFRDFSIKENVGSVRKFRHVWLKTINYKFVSWMFMERITNYLLLKYLKQIWRNIRTVPPKVYKCKMYFKPDFGWKINEKNISVVINCSALNASFQMPSFDNRILRNRWYEISLSYLRRLSVWQTQSKFVVS